MLLNNMKEFKIRCSAINRIASEAREKTIYLVGGKEITTAKYNKIVDSVLASGDTSLIKYIEIKKELSQSGLSSGSETYCKEWIKENVYGRSNYVETKYTNKGIDAEEEALNILVRALKLGMVYKNTERKTDEFKTGEIDFLHNDVIYDNKSSYSFQTFPMFETKLDRVYEDQQKGYLHLWNKKISRVCYTLVDTPIDMLANEIKWLSNDDAKQSKAVNHLFTKKAFIEAKERLFPMAKKIDFIELKDNQRVKVFEVHRDDDFINNIHINVKLCRDYIEKLLAETK